MSNEEISINSPKIITAQWIPMGVNNMISFNRHLGAHKKYASPTEFGMLGEVKDIQRGTFNMKKEGVFIYTVDYGFADHVNAHLKTSLNDKNTIGLRLDKDGLIFFGVQVPDEQLTTDEVKIFLGKLTYRFVDYIYPLLTDVQQDTLSILYAVEDILKSHFAISTYSLILTDSLGVSFNDADDFIEKYPRKIDAITDWIIEHTTIDGCHIFIGLRAALCVGTPSKELAAALLNMLFIKSLFNISFRLFSLIWSISKQTKKINKQVITATYKQLKQFNETIGDLNTKISLLSVLDEMLQIAIDEKKEMWRNSDIQNFSKNVLHIDTGFEDEEEKAQDRELVLKKLEVDIESLRESIEQRMDLIMTKNSEFLNVVLLILTLISVIGIADILGLDLLSSGIVILAMIPFLVATVIYLKNYIRNFR